MTGSNTIKPHDGSRKMGNPMFNYASQAEAVGNGFPSSDPVSPHPTMKTEKFAKPRR
jgi:hypothetical protein